MRYRFPIWLFAGILGLWALLMLFELVGHAALTPLDIAGTHRVLSSLSRSHNVLVSVILVSVALAIPITATNYTPKLLRLFLTDRIHLAVLSSYTVAAVHANFVLYLAREGNVDELLIAMTVFTSAVGFLMAVPYFFYVIWFLEPMTLVRRIRRVGVGAVESACRSPGEIPAAREMVADAIHNLGSMVLKSIDGHGRTSAAHGIVTMREFVDRYGDHKPKMDDSWFDASRSEFRGLSREALKFISADRCWVEIAALQDLTLVFESAMKRMPDAVVLVADTLRGIGVDGLKRKDAPVVENVIRTFNTMIRSAIVHAEPHAVFDVLNQYRALAAECLEVWPHLSVQVAQHMRPYSQHARQANMVFIPELFLYDVGALLRNAVDIKSDVTPGILDACLMLLSDLATKPSVPLACGALVTLGWVTEDLDDESLERFIDDVDRLIPEATLRVGLGVLDRAVSPRYHELTARQVDLNFLPPQYVESLRATFERRWANAADTATT